MRNFEFRIADLEFEGSTPGPKFEIRNSRFAIECGLVEALARLSHS